MIKEAIEYICGRAVEAAGPKTLALDDQRILSTQGLRTVNKPADVTPLEFQNLQGLVDHILWNCDKGDQEGDPKKILVVSGPRLVRLTTENLYPWNIRQDYAQAYFQECTFPFDRHLDHETFLINLQAQFADTEDRRKVLDMVGHIEEAELRTYTDDGAAQGIAVKRGLKAGQYEKVPNPVTLAPFRTFPEIEQPESRFIFRVKRGSDNQKPMCMLVEADGGAWQVEAINRIKAWLLKALTDNDRTMPVLG